MTAEDEKPAGRGIPDGLREAIEAAHAATGRTRERATELSGKTIDRAQELVDQLGRRGQDARELLEGMRLVGREELKQVEDQLERLAARIEALERKSGTGPDS